MNLKKLIIVGCSLGCLYAPAMTMGGPTSNLVHAQPVQMTTGTGSAGSGTGVSPPGANVTNSGQTWTSYTIQFILALENNDWNGDPPPATGWDVEIAQCPPGTTWVGGLPNYSNGPYTPGGEFGVGTAPLDKALWSCASGCGDCPTGMIAYSTGMYGITTWVECQVTVQGWLPNSVISQLTPDSVNGIYVVKDNPISPVTPHQVNGTYPTGDPNEYVYDFGANFFGNPGLVSGNTNTFAGYMPANFGIFEATAYTSASTGASCPNPNAATIAANNKAAADAAAAAAAAAAAPKGVAAPTGRIGTVVIQPGMGT